jgi:hypothetical protein
MSLPKRNDDIDVAPEPRDAIIRGAHRPGNRPRWKIDAATSSGFDSAERFLKTPVAGHAMQARIAL